MPKILLTNYYGSKPLAFVQKLVPEGFELIPLEQPGQDEVIRRAADADYMLVGGRTRIDAKVLDSAPKLKMIQRSGVGLDSLDLEAIRARGLPLYVNEGINARSVAEHTLMLILGTLRRIGEVNTVTHEGQWLKHEMGIDCHDLFGKQIGLIGLGSIGTHVAEILKAFGVNTVYFKRNRLESDRENQLNVRYVSLQELLEGSDIISLHTALNDETFNLIGRDELASMKDGAVLINTARGGLIDEAAMLDSLKSGQLGGAGLDAFSEEPMLSNHPLMEMNNVLATPHIGSITAETFAGMIGGALENIALFEGGKSEQISARRVV
ncbi:2-hydroxyacid dehydrogenase [Thioalkalivibrio sp. ALM2T]|uniref:2-hydroxyacid dehydrogenase n=1 Tax=Thioalkalivibrio sp. ALM2T TaxID=1158184 RepID=UPI0003730C12|nr:2-hydroxyacid dehydrogenase [Thioalkalivibrio sp. ALM2T]